jgi:hypothetical protein
MTWRAIYDRPVARHVVVMQFEPPFLGLNGTRDVASNRPISVYRLGETPIQRCGQSVSAPRVKAGATLNAHTELWAKRQRLARKAIYRNRPFSARPHLIIGGEFVVVHRESGQPRAFVGIDFVELGA